MREEMGMGEREGCWVRVAEYADVLADVALRPEVTASLRDCAEVGDEDFSLGIDQGTDDDDPESPVKLSCHNVFGLRCLITWMNGKLKAEVARLVHNVGASSGALTSITRGRKRT